MGTVGEAGEPAGRGRDHATVVFPLVSDASVPEAGRLAKNGAGW